MSYDGASRCHCRRRRFCVSLRNFVVFFFRSRSLTRRNIYCTPQLLANENKQDEVTLWGYGWWENFLFNLSSLLSGIKFMFHVLFSSSLFWNTVGYNVFSRLCKQLSSTNLESIFHLFSPRITQDIFSFAIYLSTSKIFFKQIWMLYLLYLYVSFVLIHLMSNIYVDNILGVQIRSVSLKMAPVVVNVS